MSTFAPSLMTDRVGSRFAPGEVRATIDQDDAGHGCWDAIVIGAGPAGSLAARELARRGSRVLLVDRKPCPRPKVCGACVNGRALDALRSVGLGHLPQLLSAVPVRRFSVWCDAGTFSVPLPAGVAVSRDRFDSSLVRAAIASGAEFLPETVAFVGGLVADARLVELRTEWSVDRRTTESAARVVLAADGLGRSSLAGRNEFASVVQSTSRIGGACLIANAPDDLVRGEIFMAVGRRGYVGLARLEDGSLNVAAAIEPAAVRAAGGLGRAAHDILTESGLGLAQPVAWAEWRGTPALTHRPGRVAGDRLFSLGDAAGYVEPFTGEGIAWALESAVALAPLAAQAATRWSDSLAREWCDLYARCIRRRQWPCRVLAWGLRHPVVVRLAVRCAQFAPCAAAQIVARLNRPTRRTSSSRRDAESRLSIGRSANRCSKLVSRHGRLP